MTIGGDRAGRDTCLGCGCACDDIDVRVEAGSIATAEWACDLGLAWFGDGRVPTRVLVEGREASLDAALDAAAFALAGASRPLVYLAPELSCDAQREGVAMADILRAVVDSVSSATVLPGLLAAQERGRASATLGEIRDRADVVLYWAVDPAVRYPRYASRYAHEARGREVDGRAARTVVAVDVGASRGPADADHRVALDPADEPTVLTALTAAVHESGDAIVSVLPERIGALTHAIVTRLREGRYVAIVADAEPEGGITPGRTRPDGLLALSQALNGATRCAVSLLRGGGNRSGADAVLTWQTGYPVAVDFARGYPSYQPHAGSAGALLARGDIDLVLVLGDPSCVPHDLLEAMGRVRVVAVGPRASEAALPTAPVVTIDAGVPGIHHGGMVLRLDDVPLPLRALLSGPPATEAIVRALTERIVATKGRGPGRAVV